MILICHILPKSKPLILPKLKALKSRKPIKIPFLLICFILFWLNHFINLFSDIFEQLIEEMH